MTKILTLEVRLVDDAAETSYKRLQRAALAELRSPGRHSVTVTMIDHVPGADAANHRDVAVAVADELALRSLEHGVDRRVVEITSQWDMTQGAAREAQLHARADTDR